MTDQFQEVIKNMERVEKELAYLNSHEVVVGFFGEEGSQLLTVVRANEYGAHIVPKKAQHLWVPSRQAIKEYGHAVKPKDVEYIFVPKGKHVAVRNVDGKLVVYFYLLDEVDIKPRPFIRKAKLDNQAKYQKEIEKGIEEIIYNGKTGKQLLNKLGRIAVSDIRQSAVLWTIPGNAPLTIDNKKGTDNPLIDTGKILKAVTYVIM